MCTSVSLLATTHPADPAPTMMKSYSLRNVVWSFGSLDPCRSPSIMNLNIPVRLWPRTCRTIASNAARATLQYSPRMAPETKDVRL